MKIHTGGNLKGHECDICVKPFRTLARLKKHMKLHYVQPGGMYKCAICLHAYAKSIDLREHVKGHFKKKPYKCGVCKKAFRGINNLRTHVKTHSNQKSIQRRKRALESKFKDKEVPSDEIQTLVAMEEKDVSAQTDDAAVPTEVQIHLLTPSGKEPYKCGVCEKSFVDFQALINHTREHQISRETTWDDADRDTDTPSGT